MDQSYLEQRYDESAYEKTINVDRRRVSASIPKIYIPAAGYTTRESILTLDVITPELGHQAI